MGRPRGRPKKEDFDRRNKSILIKVTPDEYKQFSMMANIRGLSYRELLLELMKKVDF